MPSSIEFIVPGPPRGKGRPRATRRGQGITLYTDEKTAAYENLCAIACQKAMKGAPPLKGAVSFKIAAHFPIAASASQKKREDMLTGEIPMTKKPDLDNVIKACLDGVNEIAFVDDAQVICIKAAKLYSEAPRLEVKIEKIGGVELALMWFRDVKNNLLDAVIGIKAEKWD